MSDQSIAFLNTLQDVIRDRMANPQQKSYTASLVSAGPKRMAQKVGEEGVEVALAATSGSTDELRAESADLIYHLLVLLAASGLSLEEVCAELKRRHSE